MSEHVVKTTRRTCDRCSEWIEFTDAAELEAVLGGWKTFGADDLCPRCATGLTAWWNDPHGDGVPVNDGSDHAFKPGTDVDGGPPSDLWCDVCGESRAKAHPELIDGDPRG